MLIREKQLKAFESEADKRFYQRLVMFLHRKYAGVTVKLPGGAVTVSEMPLDLLHRLVREGVARARGYGLSWENNLATFVSLMLDVAPNFDEHPLIRHLLRDGRVPPDARMDLVVENVSDEMWEAAGQNYDPVAWGVKYAPGDPAASLTGQAGGVALDAGTTVACPKCAARVYVGTADEGETILCDECDTMTEIVSLHPFMLNPLGDEPAAGDDEPRVEWKEEWDEEGDDDSDDEKYNWGDEPGAEDDDDDEADVDEGEADEGDVKDNDNDEDY
jgi:hypothetical protein